MTVPRAIRVDTLDGESRHRNAVTFRLCDNAALSTTRTMAPPRFIRARRRRADSEELEASVSKNASRWLHENQSTRSKTASNMDSEISFTIGPGSKRKFVAPGICVRT